ncbi:MAG: sugar isomerase domain-containing protein [Verrucomicrobia bacterium]|jgi:uncharacterized phosphosugar-binding protein|nr:MAG: sugar isomerase domain-containing protein [Verrucomicrobiota bacterium]
MSSLPELYYTQANLLLEKAWKESQSVLTQATPYLGKCIASGGVVHTFGSGHSEMVSREVIGRAGGLACVSGIVDPTEGFIENLAGYGTKLAERYDRRHELRAGEVIIVISNSGRNASPIDVALYAKKKGLTVIVITSVAMSKQSTSCHESGKRLFEVADYVLDNQGVLGDALVDLGDGIKGGPTSTFIGSSQINWLILAALEWLKANGHTMPILRSQNLPGAIEQNRILASRYKGRISMQLA